jgi:diguanylate cyclase (GGDEF)-like protein
MQSELDGLTNVFTRSAFTKRLPSLLAGAAAHKFACALGYVDVDNFKQLNDKHGHAAGDAALCKVAAVLSELVQRRGYAGRIGGDEFTFVVLGRRPFTEEEVAAQFGAKLSSLSVDVGSSAVPFTTSVGLLDVGVPTAATSPEQLFKWADELMYGVKKSGKGRCLFGTRAGGGSRETQC